MRISIKALLQHLLLLLAMTSPGRLGQAEDVRREDHDPIEALKQMSPAEGFEVNLVASEPLIRQPVAIDFDDRGRLWVIQYLQYPNPEGLKRVAVDRYSRTRYDRVPEPPPQGPRGADRITILEDVDGNGQYEHSHDFVDGLNLASGFALGHDGVFVLNVPYLLFYPDRDHNDRPDSDPQVLLTGFGMEDAHSVANSLTWGPDGWLYGCQGSTVTAHVQGIEFQQGVWRYHPVSKEFELFCEGGGNCWGLDFDSHGNLFYSTNYGGHVLVHGLPGAYYIKSFSKHGQLHNPFAYGYFEHARHTNFQGGHVTVGGVVYQEDALPSEFRGKYIAGDLLGHAVYWHHIHPQGVTFQTSHGGELLASKDPWFAPTDITIGPDGTIYVADWCDARTAHPDPDAQWDRSNGRIYRITKKGGKTQRPHEDFRAHSIDTLIQIITSYSAEPRLLSSDPNYHGSQRRVRMARRELVRRDQRKPLDEVLLHRLRSEVSRPRNEISALESLWTLASLGEFRDGSFANSTLENDFPAVRAWAVRLLADGRETSDETSLALDQMAEEETDSKVRSALACAAKRFDAATAMPIINANIIRDLDMDDPWIPHLWWWALESQAQSGRQEVIRRFVRPSLYKSRLGKEFLLPRLIRRYAAEGSTLGLECVVHLLEVMPHEQRGCVWKSVLQGIRERNPGHAPAWSERFRELVTESWKSTPEDLDLTQLAMSIDSQPALARACQDAFSPDVASSRRIALMDILGPDQGQAILDQALDRLQSADSMELRLAALRLVARYSAPTVTPGLLKLYRSTDSNELRSQVRQTLLSRRSSALSWVQAVDRGEVAAGDTTVDQIRQVTVYDDPEINTLVRKHWGQLQSVTPEDKLAEVRRLSNDLRAGAGNPAAGELLFKKHCASCHQLFGQGAKVGPDLTTANRQDRDFLLVSLVDPSSVIRKEYVSVVVQTKDGRVLSGLPVSRSESELRLFDPRNASISVAIAEIEETRDSPVSLMPADLYRQLTPQDLRDLFAHLQRSNP